MLDLAVALESARRRQASLTGVFAGDGPLREEIACPAARLGARVLGHRDDVDALMEAADVFVMPSEREGLGNAARERARTRFTAQRMVTETSQVYERALESRGGP